MATERRVGPLIAVATAAVLGMLAVPAPMPAAAQSSTAATTPIPTPLPVPATEPWWVRVAFPGRPVLAVRAGDAELAVEVAGPESQMASRDGGRTWTRIFERHGLVVPPGRGWRVVGGRLGTIDAAGAFRPDVEAPPPASRPAGTADAHGLLAAPARLPGVVVAVDRAGVVWRRGADGHWARALLLLPQHIAAGPPRITALAAFETTPLSDAVYLGSDGYSVLESTDGGDDWVRAGPGLPDQVLGLATDDTRQAVYAATSDGLWVHHLRATPTPPPYSDSALRWRLLGIALVTLAAVVAAVGALLRLLR